MPTTNEPNQRSLTSLTEELRGAETAPTPERVNILREGEMLTCGDRNAAYGDPEAACATYADLMNVYLKKRYGFEFPDLTSHDVAIFMTLMKVGRVANNMYRKDNYVDGAVYLAMAGEIASRWDPDEYS